MYKQIWLLIVVLALMASTACTSVILGPLEPKAVFSDVEFNEYTFYTLNSILLEGTITNVGRGYLAAPVLIIDAYDANGELVEHTKSYDGWFLSQNKSETFTVLLKDDTYLTAKTVKLTLTKARPIYDDITDPSLHIPDSYTVENPYYQGE